MLKLQVEGKAHQVEPFLYDLRQRPQIALHQEHVKEVSDDNQICVTCEVDLQPSRRLKIVHLRTQDGGEIRMPLLDVIHAEIEEGKTILAGKAFDIFSG
ncbi:hypothetical protein H1164_14045 [Thermoactinomyces daqus]|uniref:Uncharacterized protein n=1 Tax=Thermoactinomyces daqus TaxID=1329516 RepID=A0A7W2AIR0_9BACL|nr:hypothetical protein [Thermoactinomyces daqus]MBA4544006.1 hypothetical protein [Thermoactinomyces daqus]